MTDRAEARDSFRRGLRSLRLSGPLTEVGRAAKEAAEAGVLRSEMLKLLRSCRTSGTSGPSSRRSFRAGARSGDAKF